MRQETIIKTYLKFNELSEDQKAKAIDKNFAQDAWHFEHILMERIETLKAFAKAIGGELDYSISCVPDRGEFIEIRDFDQTLFREAYNLNNCPFTGVCYDDDILHYLNKGLSLKEVLENYLKDIHREYEWTLSEEYINDLCEANDYEFDSETLQLV